MNKVCLIPITGLCFLFLSNPASEAQNRLIYREQTGQNIVRIEVWEERYMEIIVLHSIMSNGEAYDIQNDPGLATVAFTYENTVQKTFYWASREGYTVRFEGTLMGKPFSSTARIDERPLYQSVERSLQGFAISGLSETIYFWIVLPSDAKVFQLAARREGREVVDIDGQRVEAERVKVSLPGIASIFWSSVYWYRPADGTFLRSECVRGFIGTPKTVLELVEGERL
jgi:hypothetical protein